MLIGLDAKSTVHDRAFPVTPLIGNILFPGLAPDLILPYLNLIRYCLLLILDLIHLLLRNVPFLSDSQQLTYPRKVVFSQTNSQVTDKILHCHYDICQFHYHSMYSHLFPSELLELHVYIPVFLLELL